MITDKNDSGLKPIGEIITHDVYRVRDYPINHFDHIIDIGG
jgi:hypothetical protein